MFVKCLKQKMEIEGIAVFIKGQENEYSDFLIKIAINLWKYMMDQVHLVKRLTTSKFRNKCAVCRGSEILLATSKFLRKFAVCRGSDNRIKFINVTKLVKIFRVFLLVY